MHGEVWKKSCMEIIPLARVSGISERFSNILSCVWGKHKYARRDGDGGDGGLIIGASAISGAVGSASLPVRMMH